MSASMAHQRAAYALARVKDIAEKDKAQSRRVQAAKTIALIRNAGLLKGLSYISGNELLKDIYQDVLGWLAKATEKDGPQLPKEVKHAAQENRMPPYIAGINSRLDYVRLGQEIIAIVEHIKLMAEGQKNYLASHSEVRAGGPHV